MTVIKDGTGKVVLDTATYGDEITQHYFASAALDFPSIAAASSAELTITVDEAVVGSQAVATPSGAPEAGLVWSAYVSAANKVTVRVANVTAAAVNPASRTWRADVWL